MRVRIDNGEREWFLFKTLFWFGVVVYTVKVVTILLKFALIVGGVLLAAKLLWMMLAPLFRSNTRRRRRRR